MDVELVKILSQFGFPAVVAGLLIWAIVFRFNGKLDKLVDAALSNQTKTVENTAALGRLSEPLGRLSERIDRLLDKLD